MSKVQSPESTLFKSRKNMTSANNSESVTSEQKAARGNDQGQKCLIRSRETLRFQASSGEGQRRRSQTPRQWRPLWNTDVIAGFCASALLGALTSVYPTVPRPPTKHFSPAEDRAGSFGSETPILRELPALSHQLPQPRGFVRPLAFH